MIDNDLHRSPEHVPDFSSETWSVSDWRLNAQSNASSLTEVLFEPGWSFAASSDALQPQTFDLATLWHELCARRMRVRDTFSSAERHFAVVERVPVGKRSRAHTRNLEMLTRVLLGQAPKAVAQDMRVAISTLATGMQECLRSMGLPQRASSPPVLLMMAARAAECSDLAPTLGRLTRIKPDDDRYWLVSVERPDLTFPVPLSKAEAAVVRQLISGGTHAEISKRRATSPRTIANQLASAFKKLGVSGRISTVQRLITHRSSARVACAAGLLVTD